MQGWSWAQDLYSPDKPHWGFKSTVPGSILKINVSLPCPDNMRLMRTWGIDSCHFFLLCRFHHRLIGKSRSASAAPLIHLVL